MGRTIVNPDGPAGYREKSGALIDLLGRTKPGDVVAVANPDALGDTYEELVESLKRLADAEALLAIASPTRKHSPN